MNDNTVHLNINLDTRTKGQYPFCIRMTMYGIMYGIVFQMRLYGSVSTVNTLKNIMDKFWAEQEAFYNYKTNITGNKDIML